MGARRYHLIWLLLLAALLLFAAVINVFVDPYALFGTARVAGMNAHKPKASAHTAMVKAYQIERVAPVAVLFGTSRVDIGLDPRHAELRTLWPAYNYGFPAASVLTMQQQLQHAMYAGRVRLVLVGLEFHDFLRARDSDGPGSPGQAAQRFAALSGAGGDIVRARQKALDHLNSTLTLKAFLDSIATVAAQRSPDVGDVSEQGLTSETPYAALVGSNGHHDLFLQKNRGLVEARQHAARELGAHSAAEFVEIAHLRSFLEFCRAHQIEVKLFIPPYHAHYLEIVDATGLWQRFENWKRALVNLVEEYQSKPGVPIALWDFASYDEYTTEAVPAKGDRRTAMRWFWEPVHYKRALGDIMLARMLAADQRDFGVELSSRSVEQRLASGREQRQAYRRRLPNEVEAIGALVGSRGHVVVPPQHAARAAGEPRE